MAEHGFVAVLRGAHEHGEHVLGLPPGRNESPGLRPRPASFTPGDGSPSVDGLEQQVQERVAARVEQMQAEWRLRYEQEFESARRLGHAEGLDLARQEALLQTETALKALHARWTELEGALARSWQQHLRWGEEIAVAIGYEALTRILGESSGTVPHLQRLVAQAAQAAGLKGPLKVRVSPHDWQLLQEAGIANTALGEGSASLTWLSDPNMEVGGCQIDTSGGTLDARLTTQLQALREELLRVQATKAASRDAPDLKVSP